MRSAAISAASAPLGTRSPARHRLCIRDRRCAPPEQFAEARLGCAARRQLKAQRKNLAMSPRRDQSQDDARARARSPRDKRHSAPRGRGVASGRLCHAPLPSLPVALPEQKRRDSRRFIPPRTRWPVVSKDSGSFFPRAGSERARRPRAPSPRKARPRAGARPALRGAEDAGRLPGTRPEARRQCAVDLFRRCFRIPLRIRTPWPCSPTLSSRRRRRSRRRSKSPPRRRPLPGSPTSCSWPSACT